MLSAAIWTVDHNVEVRTPDLFHALVLLNLLFVSGAWSLARPSIRSSIVLTVVGLAWLIWNKPLEGQSLFSVTVRHGVTESDLLSVAAFVIAAAGLVRAWQRSRRIELGRRYKISLR